MKCESCGHKISKQRTLKIGEWEYETETHDFNKKLSEIKIPKGWELWDQDDCFNLFISHKRQLNLDDCWFFIKQPIKEFEGEYVARFVADSDGGGVSCDGGPVGSYPGLGVRFKRKKKKGK